MRDFIIMCASLAGVVIGFLVFWFNRED